MNIKNKRSAIQAVRYAPGNKFVSPGPPFPTEGSIGRMCFEAALKGTTIPQLTKLIRKQHGSVKYWIGVFRREQSPSHRWRWYENKETQEVRIEWPIED